MQTRVSKRHTEAPRNIGRSFFRSTESSRGPESSQLLPVWPKELNDRTLAGRQALIAIIERELRKERRLGMAANSAYDIARHAKLVRLLKEEREALRQLACRDNGAAAHGSAARSSQT